MRLLWEHQRTSRLGVVERREMEEKGNEKALEVKRRVRREG